MNENLYALFESRFPADRAPAAAASSMSGAELSYAQAEAGSARYASLLAQPGRRSPAIASPCRWRNLPRRCSLYLACLRAGLVYLPLNSAYQEGEIGYFLEDAEPAVVIAQPSSMAWLRAAREAPGHRATCSGSTRTARARWTERRSAARALRRRSRARPTTSPRSSIPRAPPGAPRARCSRTATSRRTRSRCTARGASARTTCWCTCCRSSTCTASSSRCHCVLLNGTAMRFHAKFDAKQALADLPRVHRLHGRAHLLYAAAGRAGARSRARARACASSSPARRRCSPRPTSSSSSAPASASSSATA